MRVTDVGLIRAQLNTDRAWSVYALGDLAPGFAEKSEWHSLPGPEPALLLLYRAFSTPVLFTLGRPADLDCLFAEIAAEPALYLSIRPEVLPLVRARWQVTHETAMWRMVLPSAAFCPAAYSAVERLVPADVPAMLDLFADGAARGEAPDFFAEDMVARGIFYGLRQPGSGALLAVAGTHLAAGAEGVAAIGNVYTRSDQRGRGLARQVTSAVAAELLAHQPAPLVALNVSQSNPAALRVYESIGFQRYCAFYEGLAARPVPAGPPT